MLAQEKGNLAAKRGYQLFILLVSSVSCLVLGCGLLMSHLACKSGTQQDQVSPDTRGVQNALFLEMYEYGMGSDFGDFSFSGRVYPVENITAETSLSLRAINNSEGIQRVASISTPGRDAAILGDSFFDRETGYFLIDGITSCRIMRGGPTTLIIDLKASPESQLTVSQIFAYNFAPNPAVSPSSVEVRSARAAHIQRLNSILKSQLQWIQGLTLDPGLREELDENSFDFDVIKLTELTYSISLLDEYNVTETSALFDSLAEQLQLDCTVAGVWADPYYRGFVNYLNFASLEAQIFSNFASLDLLADPQFFENRGDANQIVFDFYRGTHVRSEITLVDNFDSRLVSEIASDTGRPNLLDQTVWDEYDELDFEANTFDFGSPVWSLEAYADDVDEDGDIDEISWTIWTDTDRRIDLDPIPVNSDIVEQNFSTSTIGFSHIFSPLYTTLFGSRNSYIALR